MWDAIADSSHSSWQELIQQERWWPGLILTRKVISRLGTKTKTKKLAQMILGHKEIIATSSKFQNTAQFLFQRRVLTMAFTWKPSHGRVSTLFQVEELFHWTDKNKYVCKVCNFRVVDCLMTVSWLSPDFLMSFWQLSGNFFATFWQLSGNCLASF